VILPCGHSFSRKSLEQWFASQQGEGRARTCPICKTDVSTIINATPNWALRGTIERYKLPSPLHTTQPQRGCGGLFGTKTNIFCPLALCFRSFCFHSFFFALLFSWFFSFPFSPPFPRYRQNNILPREPSLPLHFAREHAAPVDVPTYGIKPSASGTRQWHNNHFCMETLSSFGLTPGTPP
jgi:hypothetical protein